MAELATAVVVVVVGDVANKLMYVRMLVCTYICVYVCSHQHICAWFTFKMLIEFSGANINI